MTTKQYNMRFHSASELMLVGNWTFEHSFRLLWPVKECLHRASVLHHVSMVLSVFSSVSYVFHLSDTT